MPDPLALSTAHLSTAHSWRGGENQILLLCKGLLARGQQALILAPHGAPLLERAREADIPTHSLTLRGPLDPVGVWRLARLLRKLKPHLLHLHDGHAILPGKLAARALPADRLAVFAHRRTAFAVRGASKFGGRIDQVVAISAVVREQLLAAGVPRERVAVVYSGLEFTDGLSKDGAAAQALRRELGLRTQDFLIAHAAALTSEKRQADLLAALVATKDCGARRVHLAIAGTGALEEALRSRVQSLGLAGRAHFLGFRRDLRALWAAADAASFASETEGLCTALIEAQGAGLPAVITRAGGMLEVVEADVTGLTVPVGGVKELATAWTRLAQDPELCEKLGRQASKRTRTRFSADAMAARMLSLYKQAWRSKER